MRKKTISELINDKYKEYKSTYDTYNNGVEGESKIFGIYKVIKKLEWLKSFHYESLFKGLWRFFSLVENNLWWKVITGEVTQQFYEKKIKAQLNNKDNFDNYNNWLHEMLELQLQRVNDFKKLWREPYDIKYDNNGFDIIKLSNDGNAMYFQFEIIDRIRETNFYKELSKEDKEKLEIALRNYDELKRKSDFELTREKVNTFAPDLYKLLFEYFDYVQDEILIPKYKNRKKINFYRWVAEEIHKSPNNTKTVEKLIRNIKQQFQELHPEYSKPRKK